MFTILLLLAPLARGNEYTRSVNTSWGVVRGELVSPSTQDLPPVTQFLGIPYGSPPVSSERFHMVKSASKWTHAAKETRKLSPSCMQSSLPELSETRAMKQMPAQRFDFVHRLYPKLKVQSEDCLYMNLFVPERLHVTPLSVLVLIHGDEYGWGSGGPFNGTTLASFGQLIVVTLNYRLGVFGFLGRCESSSCKGNEGLSDIIAALTMLGGILPAFGGNPREITLLGWGSGASLVSLLMASPLTQPHLRLFKRAILLDGTALAPWALSHDPQSYFLTLATKLQCNPKPSKSSPYTVSVEKIISCLQKASTENITSACQSIVSPSFLSTFAPIVDGQLVPNKPSLLFSPPFGSLFREIDLMVGTVTHPAHHFLSNDDLSHGMSSDKKQKILRTLARNIYNFHRKEVLAAIENEYTDWNNPKESGKSLRDSVLSTLSDALFVAPLIETLRAHSSDETSRDANTFFFHFGHETRSWNAEQPHSGIRGSLSGDHLAYILGYPLSRMDKDEKLYTGFDAEDRGISKVIMHYVANFVKSGDPHKPFAMSTQTPTEEHFAKMTWPQFNEANREAYLDIGATRDKPSSIRNFYRNARVGFWTKFIPKLQEPPTEKSLPDEHSFLDDHLNGETFFGKVRPLPSEWNTPIPPPPLPPTPPPSLLAKSSPPPSTSSTSPSPPSTVSAYSNVLPLTVSIGCALLILNICILFGMIRSYNRRSMKKNEAERSFLPAHCPNTDVQYTIHSPLMSLPAPPSLPPSSLEESLGGNGIMCASLPRLSTPFCPHGSFSLHEEEPLLSASHKSSMVGIRQGVSPTCPRHGRSAMASRGNSTSVGGGTPGRDCVVRDNHFNSLPPAPPPLEEIQV